MTEWRQVPGAPDYDVSDDGRIFSRRRGSNRELNGWLDKKGYRKVFLYDDSGKRLERFVHAVVCEAFHGPRPVGQDVRHLDGDKVRNTVDNLRYGSRSENELDKVRHGTHQNARKTHCKWGHPYDEANTHVTPAGWRDCLTCRRSRRGAA